MIKPAIPPGSRYRVLALAEMYRPSLQELLDARIYKRGLCVNCGHSREGVGFHIKRYRCPKCRRNFLYGADGLEDLGTCFNMNVTKTERALQEARN